MSERFRSYDVESMTLKQYVMRAVLLLSVGVAVFYTLLLFGLDPFWSLKLAEHWCDRPEWVHLDTTLLYALVRDSASLLGLGIASHYLPQSQCSSVSRRIVTSLLALVVTQGSELAMIPTDLPMLLFYLLGAIKSALVIFIVVFVGRFFCRSGGTDDHAKRE